MKAGIKWIAAALFAVTTSFANAQSPSTVLVVANANNNNSMILANYYAGRRGIPAQNVLQVNWSADDNADTCSLSDYTNKIAAPIYAKIATLSHIDYIVLCRNLPSKISDTTGSVDSALAGKTTSCIGNPYYGKLGVPFSSTTYGVYLVTRLDGWSWNDAAALVDRSLSAVPGGLFFCDEDPTKNSQPAYSLFNSYLGLAKTYLSAFKQTVSLDTTNSFVNPGKPLAGYASWGSNDCSFSYATYNALQFAPGAISETAVSTSGSNIRYPGGGQSQIAQLVHNGVTGIKGYVSEPQISATANPYMLFLDYVVGRNLAESFYSASRYMGWKDVILGDPLCAPYRK